MGRGCLYSVEEFSQNFLDEGVLESNPRKIPETGSLDYTLECFYETKGNMIPKIGSPRLKSVAPIFKVKIPKRTPLDFGGYKGNISTESPNLGAARGLASHPVWPHPTNHHCL